MVRNQSHLPFVLLGGVCATGQAPLYLWPCSLITLILFFKNLTEAPLTGWKPFTKSWLFGFGYFLITMNWIVEPFLVEVASYGWLAPFALIAMAGGLSFFWALGAYLGYIMFNTVLGIALGIGFSEVARGFVLTGLPWGLIGYIWTDTPIAQSAAFVGVYGLTFSTIFLSASASLLGNNRGYSLAIFYLLAIIGGVWLAGSLRVTAPSYSESAKTIRLSQPNAPQEQKWDPDFSSVFFERQLKSTSAEPKPDLVIWPETTLPVPFEMANSLVKKLSEVADGTPVLLGSLRYEGNNYFNSIIYFDETGTAVSIYDKHHLVPFGEYLPFENFLVENGFRNADTLFGAGLLAGPGPKIIDIKDLGKVMPLICYEAVFPQDVGATSERADVIVQLTNDAWFGRISGPQQHLSKAQMRSIEQGLPLIRVANTGISGLIDPFGRVQAFLPLNEAGFLDIRVPEALPASIYSRFGLRVVACLALLLFVFCFLHSSMRSRVDVAEN